MQSLLKVRVAPGDYREAAIPDVTLEMKPQFPHEWFSANPGVKPSIQVPKSDLTDEELGKRISITWIDATSVEELLEFMVRYIEKNFKAKLTHDWNSYGLTIGTKDQEITALSLLKVEYVNYTPASKVGSSLDDKEITTKFCELMSLYRIQNATQNGGNYSDRVFERIQKVFTEPPFSVKSLDSANIITNSSWANNDSYRKLIAVVDMFFNMFRDHKFSKIKVTTLSSRNKDCGGLTPIRDLSKYLACSTVDALKYVMDARAGPELMRLITEPKEMMDVNSYFHYFKELGLSLKSPYSSSVNPALYNFIYSLGTFLGISRSFNARLFSEDGINNSVNLAAYVAFYTKNWIRTALILETEEVLKANDAVTDGNDNSSEAHDHLFIYNKIVETDRKSVV